MSSDDDDDNDVFSNTKKSKLGSRSMPTLVVARNRSVRTENTPVRSRSPPVSIDEADAVDDGGTGDNDRGVAHTGSRWRGDERRSVLATGIQQGASSIVVNGFKDYQREDGLDGPQGASGSNDQYNIDYMREYNRRLQLLSTNPDYRFANLVLGNTNGDVFFIIDEGAFRREIERAVARAREEARKALSRADTISELRKETKFRQDELKEVAARINMLNLRSNTWSEARDMFAAKLDVANGILAGNSKFGKAVTKNIVLEVQTSRGLDTLETRVFDLLTRIAWMKYGYEGVLKPAFANDVEQIFRSIAASYFNRVKTDLKDQMPQVADVALYIAALKALSSSRSLLNSVAKRISFPADSEYAKVPDMFEYDLSVLADMIIPDSEDGQVGGPVTFRNISLLFYAHINTMAKRAGLPDSDLIAKPIDSQGAEQPKATTTRKKKIFGKEVDVNVADETLARAAVGEAGVFTEQELLAYKRKLFQNTESAKTVSLIQKLLLSVFQNGFGLLFFVDLVKDSEIYDQIYTESRYPVESSQVVRSVFQRFRAAGSTDDSVTVAKIFDIAVFLLSSDQEKPSSVSTYIDMNFADDYQALVPDLLLAKNNVTEDWLRYEKNLRDSVVKRTVLPEIAKILATIDESIVIKADPNNNNDKQDKPIVFSEADQKAIFDYNKLDATSTLREKKAASDAVLSIYDNRIPHTAAFSSKKTLDGIKSTPSNWSFERLMADKAIDPVFPVPTDLQKTKEKLEKSIGQYKDRINEVLTKTPDQVNKEIYDNLGFSTATSRQWASLPTNSGILTLSPRFIAALSKATSLVRREVPSLAQLSDEDLQRNPRTEEAFASLVAHKILLINATNPGQYQRDATIRDLKILIGDDIYALRSVRFGDRSDNCGSRTRQLGAPQAARSLKRDYAEFFK
jgi:hypothetical protein